MATSHLQEVFDFVQKNAGELDEALDYDRDLGYDYFGPSVLGRFLRVDDWVG